MSKVVEFSQIDKIREKEEIKEKLEKYDKRIEGDCIKLVNELKSNPDMYDKLFSLLAVLTIFATERNELLKSNTSQ